MFSLFVCYRWDFSRVFESVEMIFSGSDSFAAAFKQPWRVYSARFDSSWKNQTQIRKLLGRQRKTVCFLSFVSSFSVSLSFPFPFSFSFSYSFFPFPSSSSFSFSFSFSFHISCSLYLILLKLLCKKREILMDGKQARSAFEKLRVKIRRVELFENARNFICRLGFVLEQQERRWKFIHSFLSSASTFAFTAASLLLYSIFSFRSSLFFLSLLYLLSLPSCLFSSRSFHSSLCSLFSYLSEALIKQRIEKRQLALFRKASHTTLQRAFQRTA